MELNTVTQCAQHLRCYAELAPDEVKSPKKPGRVRKPAVNPKASPTATQQMIKDISKPYGGFVFVFDTETTPDVALPLTVGCFMVFGISDQMKIKLSLSGMLDREALDTPHQSGLFYNHDNITCDELTIIKNYAKSRNLPLFDKTYFVTQIFYDWVYRKQALCVGHNLPFDLSRLAIDSTEARGAFSGGFSLRLCTCDLPPNKNAVPIKQCMWHPKIRVKSLGGKKGLIAFEGLRNDNKPCGEEFNYRGKFLDTATFGRALLGPGNASLLGLGKRFKAPILKTDGGEHGIITPEYLDYLVNDVKATFSLFQKERDLFKLHDVSRAPWSILSEASLGKAYFKELGVVPFMKKHADFPKPVIGYFMSAYYGGRSEVKYRRAITECVYADFKSQYPTVNALMGLQDLLIADRIDIVQDTYAVTQWIDTLTIDDLQSGDTWKKLRGICQVIPDNDILPLRSNYDDESPAGNIGVNIITSPIPTWYTFADVIASKLLTGKTPHIVDSIELIPVGQYPTNKKILFNNPIYSIDLTTDELFTKVIDLRTEVRQEAKHLDKTSADYQYLDGLQIALKLLANATSYGVLVEVTPDERLTPQKGTIYKDDVKDIVATGLEKPGTYFAGPLGALIPAGGRLLLAIAEKLAADRGLRVAMCDTDSNIFAKPDAMNSGDFQTAVKSITAWFNPLSPYNTTGALFELEDVNFDEAGQIQPLFFTGVSTKRYSVFNLSDDDTPIIRKFTTHGLGHIISPAGYESETPCLNPDAINPRDRWVHDLWVNHINSLIKNTEPVINHKLRVPVISSATVSSAAVLRNYSNLPNIKPFCFFTTTPGLYQSSKQQKDDDDAGLFKTTFYSPFTTDWRELKGKVRRKDTHDIVNGWDGAYMTIADCVKNYFTHGEAKSYPSTGEGWLERRHMRVVEHVYMGKEYSEKHGQAMQLNEVVKTHFMPLAQLGLFGNNNVISLLNDVCLGELNRLTELPRDYLNNIKMGRCEPSREHQIIIAEGVTQYHKTQRTDLQSLIKKATPFKVAKAAKLGLRTVYNVMNGVNVKQSTLTKIQNAVVRLL
jgi:hypothetical protein